MVTQPAETYGFLSLVPALTAVALAFITREALFSIFCGVMTGVVITGQNPIFGFSEILLSAVGNTTFMWVVELEVFIGIMVAFFQKSGAIDAVYELLNVKLKITARAAKVLSAAIGIFVFFSDYFSPLFVGNVMRPITDRMRISREKLAFYCDCTSAPKCIMIPWAAWGVYVAGLLVGVGTIADADMGMAAVVGSLKFQFYGAFTILLVFVNAFGLIPDFGPMRRAEKRARETGAVVAEGDTPMLSSELDEIKPPQRWKPSVFLHFVMPALVVVGFALWTWYSTGAAKVPESFMVAVLYQAVVLLAQRAFGIQEIMRTAVKGIKSVMWAMLILALAYCINLISKNMGTSTYVVGLVKSWISPSTLFLLAFLVSAFMAFFTGTSWGVYAIMMPIVIPLALDLSGGEMGNIVFATVASVMGGGCFGDHCSPLSDTTVLSALGSGSDLIAHVKTQLPYAAAVAMLSCLLYVIVGLALK